jgi:hypothetical protein
MVTVITKDLCTYAMKILREEKTLRDHRTGTRLAALRTWTMVLM